MPFSLCLLMLSLLCSFSFLFDIFCTFVMFFVLSLWFVVFLHVGVVSMICHRFLYIVLPLFVCVLSCVHLFVWVLIGVALSLLYVVFAIIFVVCVCPLCVLYLSCCLFVFLLFFVFVRGSAQFSVLCVVVNDMFDICPPFSVVLLFFV